jgi:hypothetical protein
MIYQRFGLGVSNLSTVAELRTFDGTSRGGGGGVSGTKCILLRTGTLPYSIIGIIF